MDELSQAGQALDPEREMQELDMPGRIGGLVSNRPLWVIDAECVNCDRECSRRCRESHGYSNWEN